MSKLKKAAELIVNETDWSFITKASGVELCFNSGAELEFNLLLLNDSIMVFYATITTITDDAVLKKELLNKVAALSLYSSATKASVLSLEASSIILHLFVHLNDRDSNQVINKCKDFLNDLEWWKKNVIPQQQNQQNLSLFNQYLLKE